MDEKEPVARRFRRRPLVAGAVVAGVFAVSLGVAYAQTGSATSPTTAPPTQIAPGAPPVQSSVPGQHFGRGHRRGQKLFGFGRFGGLGKFGGIHGEFTTKKPDGTGYQTWVTQLGEATEVSPSSITVKSEDGFSRTYSVDDTTLVNAGRHGIGTVKVGDTVRVTGLVENGPAKAAAVIDSTSLGKLGEHWGFPRRK